MKQVSFPTQARVVVIGGGIVGCSTAYHLARAGVKDVVLIEKDKLTSGSTWHAAGAVGQLRSNANITRMLGYSVDLYGRLEEETGQPTGWVRNGSLRLACTPERMAEYERAATMAHSFGLEFEFITPKEVQDRIPQIDVSDVIGAAWVESDGVANPTDITMALAKGARMHGARIFEDTAITGIGVKNGRVTSVSTTQGDIACETVVNCAGIWAPEIGRMAGVLVALQPALHQYMVTEKIEGLGRHIPTVRDPDNVTYFKEEVGGLAVGGYEFNPKPFLESPIPDSHAFRLMEEDSSHFEPILEAALRRFPALETTGVKTWFHGVEAFTEDGMFILGEAPELRNFFIGAGFNAFGIASGGGAGRVLAEWIIGGEQPFDMWAADPRRFSPYHRSPMQLRERSLEGQGKHYAIGWPFSENKRCRTLRRSAIYPHLKDRGASFGAKSGWERPNWFAPEGASPVDDLTFGRGNWFGHVAAEHVACRDRVAVFDQSSFAKFTLIGPDAEAVLSRICAGDMTKPPGSVIYTQMLNPKGGIEADITVTRISEIEYYIVSGTGFATRDFNHIKRRIPEDARAILMDVTSAYGTLSVMGPKARDLLARIAEADLSNAAFPFGTCQTISLMGAQARALRMTFVGELGWELHIPTEYMAHTYELLLREGAEFGLVDAGYRAIDSLRLEKAFRVWGHEVGPDYTPYEAGLGFAVALEKNTGFIGRDALLRQREAPLPRRLGVLRCDDPDVILYGRETILRDGKVVGWLTSGGYGHTLKTNIGLGYVAHDSGADWTDLAGAEYQLEVRTRRVPARFQFSALHDPKNEKMKI